MASGTTKDAVRDALARSLRPGATVFLAGGMGLPRAIVALLDDHPEWLRGVHLITTDAVGFDNPCPRVLDGELTLFLRPPPHSPGDGPSGSAGLVSRPRFVPMQYRRIFDWLERDVEVDLLLVQLCSPDARGGCAFGLGLDFLPAVLPRAKRVIAQLNPLLPALRGGASVAIERLDAWFEEESALPESSSRCSDVTSRIASQVASLIDDGDCLQTGIGALPDAILAALEGHRDLGCHSGMISDGVRELVERGVLTGARKTIDAGRVVTGFLLGSGRLYSWAEQIDCLDLRPVSYTHDPRVLASIDNFVAINSAVEVDLFGAVNAETVGGRQVSGVGGAVDFARGAALSRGGRSLIALPAVTRDGVSRITARFGGSSSDAAGRVVPPATLLRTDVDAIVTEHGVALLRARSDEERAAALIGIAAPEHRLELSEAWQDLVSAR
jgi:4-hydroxybutyrate CoA-transferase